ncbi:MAG TPA: hypothetical protein PLA97_16160, partial [Rubrivivax sp.]|nr:hypothetical protein [Rubrivivax sp.]
QMITNTAARAWRLAVGAPLERGVRPHSALQNERECHDRGEKREKEPATHSASATRQQAKLLTTDALAVRKHEVAGGTLSERSRI